MPHTLPKTQAATLGIAGIALAGLVTVTPTQAQEESYINSCQLGCYVPPQTEDECEELWRDRQSQAYNELERWQAR